MVCGGLWKFEVITAEVSAPCDKWMAFCGWTAGEDRLLDGEEIDGEAIDCCDSFRDQNGFLIFRSIPFAVY